MRLVKIATGMAMVLSLALAPVDATPNGPKGPSSVKASSTKAPKVAKATTAPKAPKTTTAPKVAKTTKVTKATTVTTKSAKADAKLARVEAKSAKKTGTTSTTTSTTTNSTTSSTSTSGTTTSGGTTTTSTTIDFTNGPVAEKLAKNSNLRTKLESRLQAIGYEGTVYQAAYGFKNQGQFVAATNVSRNLGISFDQLKVQMTGLSVAADGTVLNANLAADGTVTMVDSTYVTKAVPTKSLGQAIKTVKSSVDATAAAQTATTQADAEIAATSTVTN